MSRANKVGLELILGQVGGGALEGGWVLRVDAGISAQGKIQGSLYPEHRVEEDPENCLALGILCIFLLRWLLQSMYSSSIHLCFPIACCNIQDGIGAQ